MRHAFRRLRERASDSSGMTLIEVVVAISLMGITATAAVSLAITSQTSASTQQRQELAVTVVNEAMELVNAHAAATNPSTGMSYLYDGRTERRVEDAWTLNAGTSGLDASYPGWDFTATDSSTPALAISNAVTRSGTDYTVYTLFGTCYMPTDGGDCGLVADRSAPGATTELTRVIVVARWNAGGCPSSGCNYQATSLIDSHTDLVWNTQ